MFGSNKKNLKYTCLFGGGAIRGMTYIGVIRALEELQVEYDIIGGSSVGSISATLLAYGYTSEELKNIFMDVNFDLFMDFQFGFGKNIGLSKGERFIDWLNELINKKTHTDKPQTFADLAVPLVIITTDLNGFKCQEFSRYTTPDFEIAKAIRISSSMPGLMPPFEYNGMRLVDGDLQKGAPMWCLSETLQNSESKILEFRLEGSCGESSINPLSYINTIHSCVTSVATDFITDIYGQNEHYNYVKINTGKVFFADLNLNKADRLKLIESGYKQTMDYFNNTLVNKQNNISNIYSKIIKLLKQIQNELTFNQVKNVQMYLGKLYIILCENKEIINPKLYNKIENFKNSVDNSEAKILFSSYFKNSSELKLELKNILTDFEQRI